MNLTTEERQRLNRIYSHLSAEQADHRDRCRGLDKLFDDLPFVFQCISKLLGEEPQPPEGRDELC